MLRILIADDEKKIGLLVRELIDWEGLDLELIGIVQDGREARDIILREEPDIVITDIRMPNLSGLDMIKAVTQAGKKVHFIVISGYRYFEYAQTALKYGVEDYLLKPIEEEELNRILYQVCDAEKRKKKESLRIEHLEKKLDNSKYILHKELMNQMIDCREHILLSEVNEDYGVNLTAGIFRALCIKVDRSIREERNPAQEKLIVQKLIKLTEETLREGVTDLLCSEQDSMSILVLLNYDNEQQKQIQHAINELHLRFCEYIAGFGSYEVTLGVSGEVGAFEHIKYLLEMAREAVHGRLFAGTGKRLDNYSERFDTVYQAARLAEQYSGKLRQSVEIMDAVKLESCIRTCFATAQQEGLMAYEFYELARELIVRFCTAMAEYFQKDMGGILEEWLDTANHCNTVGMLTKYLVSGMGAYTREQLQVKSELERRPVIEAVEYIRQNYREKISLEDIAADRGFNANYFSELFKNETGKNFTAYLLEVRMEAAKVLLRDSRDTIYEIAEKVGYRDAKFFSQQFTKTVGIKPTEYRKLYY